LVCEELRSPALQAVEFYYKRALQDGIIPPQNSDVMDGEQAMPNGFSHLYRGWATGQFRGADASVFERPDGQDGGCDIARGQVSAIRRQTRNRSPDSRIIGALDGTEDRIWNGSSGATTAGRIEITRTASLRKLSLSARRMSCFTTR
jgi:hypothetical protein